MNAKKALLRSVCALLAGLALTLAATSVFAQGLKSDSKVKATAKADKPDADGKQVVTLTLTIEKGWHLYANPVGLEDLESSKTTVTVSAKVKPEEVKIEYPAGKSIKDAVGEYKVYEDKAEIKIIVRRAKDDTSPLELAVKLQACSDKTCLLPAEIKLKVE
jgi:DsbC/DsbD-like thiol-disulfide interchange protein